MRRNVQVLMAMLLLVPSVAAAGTLTGGVFRRGDPVPLAGARVTVVDAAGNEAGSTATGRDGRYAVEVPDGVSFRVTVSADGYGDDTSKERTGAGSYDAYLTPLYALDEVEVVADRDPSRVARTTISGRELHCVPGSGGDPLRGAIALPGVTTANDASASPAVRGSGPADNRSFVDRIPLPYLFHMGGMVSVLPEDLVADFTLYSAAFGPEFGDATGAVFDVTLRDPREERFRGTVSMSMMEADLLLEGPVGENGGIAASARRSYIDLFLPQTGDMGDGVQYRQFPQFSDYMVKGVYRFGPDNTLSMLVDGARDEMILELTEDSPDVVHDPILAGQMALNQEFHQQGGTLTSRMGWGTNYLTLAHATYKVDQSLSQLGHAFVAYDSRMLREHLDVPVGDSHLLSIGGDAGASDVDLDLDIVRDLPNDYTPPADFTSARRARYLGTIHGTGYGVFVKDRWRIADPLTLVAGVRHEYGDYLDEHDTLPRAGIEWAVTPDATVTAGWGEYRQDPQGVEIIAEFGNPELTRTRAVHSVVGYEQRMDDGWTVKLEGYDKQFSDLVVPDEEHRYLNEGSGTAQGAELLVKRAGDLWSGWVSMAWSRTTRRNDLTGEDFSYSYDQPVIVNAVGSWSPWENWTVGFRWRYQSGSPFTPVIGTYEAEDKRIRPVYGDLGSERLPDYHRLDLRIDRTSRYKTWTMVWFLEVINAYARENVSGYTYNEDYSDRTPVSQLPLFPSFGVKATF